MSESPDYFREARSFAVDILKRQADRTPARIEEIAAVAKQAIKGTTGAEIDEALLVSELMHLFSIQVDAATILEDHDPARHVPWLPARRASVKWRFWERYSTYLQREIGMAPNAVESLGDLTELILERLEDPGRDGPWDRRGMVVGSVQSGKTANYIGLVSKAIDSGYKLVVILAGVHSNLRAQTQLRVDEGVLGFDTKKSRRLNQDSRRIGVGRLPGDTLFVHSLTSSAEDGDFNQGVANTVGVMIGGDPVVLVVKKNVSVLTNLVKWVGQVATLESRNGKQFVAGTPLLLIDDEADNASINTKKVAKVAVAKAAPIPENSVTAINGQIRSLLDLFEKSAYVGYTATPFANIFIDPEAETPLHGEDLFPRSFIINVQAPSNYVGPAKVFGLKGDPDADIPSSPGLPIVRYVDDYDNADCFPANHKKDHRPKRLPDSLLRAVRCFVLSSAARHARGHGHRHHSMLIHVTRFVDVQAIVVDLVKKEILGIQRRVAFGDGARAPGIKEQLRALWIEEFQPLAGSFAPGDLNETPWEAVEAQLHNAASKCSVLPINGFAKEALDYKEHEKEGMCVIAVGGDKLSRGLTLEGLSTSYFLRTSKMYDTLMQMGRWFGYRDGYLDLCRVYTTTTLIDWYRHIALAELELRREFDYMVSAGLTPEQYGLRVRTHPDGMVVTALNKMSHSRTLELSWEGVLVQTAQLPRRTEDVQKNLGAVESLLAQVGKPVQSDGLKTKLWTNVDAAAVARFVEAMRFPPESSRASGPQLASFIRQESRKDAPELTSWCIGLVSNSSARLENRRNLSGLSVGLVERTAESQNAAGISLKKSNLISPLDQSLDLQMVNFTALYVRELLTEKAFLAEEVSRYPSEDGTLFDLALWITRGRIAAGKLKGAVDTKVPNGRVVRELRLKRNALMLIYPVAPPLSIPAVDDRPEEATGLGLETPPVFGLALSFPTSDSTSGVEYQVNDVWGDESFEDELYEE